MDIKGIKSKFPILCNVKIRENQNVLIVEDVITTGKSVLECLKIVEACKAKVLGFACIIDRSNSKLSIKDRVVSQMEFKIETYKEHLEAVYGLPMFYGDETLKSLLSHTSDLAEELTELKSVFFLAEDTEGEVLSGQEEKEE